MYLISKITYYIRGIWSRIERTSQIIFCYWNFKNWTLDNKEYTFPQIGHVHFNSHPTDSPRQFPSFKSGSTHRFTLTCQEKSFEKSLYSIEILFVVNVRPVLMGNDFVHRVKRSSEWGNNPSFLSFFNHSSVSTLFYSTSFNVETGSLVQPCPLVE